MNEHTKSNISISLCGDLPVTQHDDSLASCPQGTSVCSVSPNGTALVYGRSDIAPIIGAEGSDTELLVMFTGDACPHADVGENYTTVLHFKCGKTMVSAFCMDLHVASNIHIKLQCSSFLNYAHLPTFACPFKSLSCSVSKMSLS